MRHTKMILVGGWAMVLFALLYVGFTIWIDTIVQNQPMLYDLEQHQLFKVMAGSETIRALLAFYSVVPLLLIPAAVGGYYLFIENHEANMRVGMYFATVSAIGMTLSLMMLPSINWFFATAIPSLPATLQASMVIMLKGLHDYLGVFVGDILGLGCALVWMFICSLVALNDRVLPKIVGWIEFLLALFAAVILILQDIFSIHLHVQVNAIIALWVFIFGIGLISLRRI